MNKNQKYTKLEIYMQSVGHLLHAVVEFLKGESGVSLIECILIGAIIAVVSALSFLALSKEMQG
ncbi:hypothetical protein B2J88_10405 [Rhodococcus sp. SRB_17]|nr:hypothetical protein [Rhodococcus sp. SRB_17]